MELNSGKDFFTQIIAGEITKDNVISRITAANTLSTITATP